jgi:hypothetical protein
MPRRDGGHARVRSHTGERAGRPLQATSARPQVEGSTGDIVDERHHVDAAGLAQVEVLM